MSKIGFLLGTGMERTAEELCVAGARLLGRVYINKTSAGQPASYLEHLQIDKKEIFLLHRHGLRHEFNPATIPYMANVLALKEEAVDEIFSLGTAGALNKDLNLGQFYRVVDFLQSNIVEYEIMNTVMPYGSVKHFSTKVGDLLGNIKAKLNSDGIVYAQLNSPDGAKENLVKSFQAGGAGVVGMTLYNEARVLTVVGVKFGVAIIISDSMVEEVSPVWDRISKNTANLILAISGSD